MTDKKLEVDLNAPLVFEFVKMPIRDLSIPFLYRFKGPIETVWTAGAFTFPDFFETMKLGYIKEDYEKFALKTWDNYLQGDESEDIKDLLRRNSVSVVECEITPK
jgi:hypothetical protein